MMSWTSNCRRLPAPAAAFVLCGAVLAARAEELKLAAYLSHDKLAAGSQFRVAVVVDLNKPWHINAHEVGMEGLVPTTLTLDSPPHVSMERIEYPKGERIRVSWADEPVALYTGRVVIFAHGRVHAHAPQGPVRIEGRLRYQACDDTVCLAPKTVPVILATEIVDATETPQPLHPEIFAAGTEPSTNSIDRLIRERGWLIALVFVFFGGLALNLTPCVYPMIAITVSYFGGQKDRSSGRAFAHALVYFLGIVITYSALGLAAALTGGLFGALLQSPAVLIGIGVLLVVLALSMFGLFELQPPQFLMQKATGLSSKAGYVGVFFLGAMVGIIAAPCIAPILVALLVFVGQRADPWVGWWMFFTLAVGLGLPYVVLGTFSGLLSRLPKSGTWMVWVKRVFGVALLAVAAWITNPLWMRHAPAADGIRWSPYSPSALRQAAAENRHVIIDFYADWCIPCKEMDKRTFSDPRVIQKSEQFRMLKADLTRTGSPEVQRLTKEFEIHGVPTTIFIGPDGNECRQLRQVGFVRADEFLQIMDRALTCPASPAAERRPKSPAEEIPPQLMQPF